MERRTHTFIMNTKGSVSSPAHVQMGMQVCMDKRGQRNTLPDMISQSRTQREKKKKQSTGHYTHWNKHTESVRVKAINSNLSTRFYRPSVAETQQPKIFSKRMCEQVRKTHPSVQCCSTLFHLLCDIRHM